MAFVIDGGGGSPSNGNIGNNSNTNNNSNSNNNSGKKIDKKTKITPEVKAVGDGTADDVIRANISYVPGAESVQVQVKYWDEIKAYHVKSIEIDADQIAKVFQTFMRNLCSNCRPTYRYMETAESYKTKKEGRAGVSRYTGATGIRTDRINQLNELIVKAYDDGDSMDNISRLTARRNELIDEEVEEINGAMKE